MTRVDGGRAAAAASVAHCFAASPCSASASLAWTSAAAAAAASMPLASMRCASMPLLGAATRRAFHSSRALAQDHYRVLGVAASASKDEIKKQYYKVRRLNSLSA